MSEHEPRGDREIIRTARREAAAAVRQFNSARAAGQVSGNVKRDLANAALNYYDTLYEYRDEGALEEEWSERGVEWLESAAMETVETEKSLPRANGSTTTVEQPLLMAVNPVEIRDAIRELNDIAKELGFAPSAREHTPSDEADMKDLRGLLKARGQTEALENLPGGEEEAEVSE